MVGEDNAMLEEVRGTCEGRLRELPGRKPWRINGPAGWPCRGAQHWVSVRGRGRRAAARPSSAPSSTCISCRATPAAATGSAFPPNEDGRILRRPVPGPSKEL